MLPSITFVAALALTAVQAVPNPPTGVHSLKEVDITPTRVLPESFIKALHEKRHDSSATSTPADGVEYLVPITAGSQILNLDFDIGSADLWVFSSLLPSTSQKGRDYHSSFKWTTYEAISNCKGDISYADGSGASDVCGTDMVNIGATTVAGPAIGLARKVPSALVSDTADGLVGLAFNAINTVTPIGAKTQFNANGAYDFGFVDARKFAGNISFVTVSLSGGFWEFSGTLFKVGTTIGSMAGLTGIADIEANLILTTNTANSGQADTSSHSLTSCHLRIRATVYATIPPALMSYQAISSTSVMANIYGDVFFNA
ncbi:putative endothiapepsin [Calycina marina]|uniref:Endothiapepsin n=1 Tax=Calycina marina TaxID=1763456 RepID=A0A9P8CDQ8_9HELO|nr:putative endothiapepsin [Calycina marina]